MLRLRLALLASVLSVSPFLAISSARAAGPSTLGDGDATSRPVAPAVSVQKLALVAKDGQKVPGWLHEAPPAEVKAGDTSWRKDAHAVVLLHMFRSDHEAWDPILPELKKSGITALAIDMRGHGENVKGPKGEDLARLVVARDEDLFRSMYMDAFAAIDKLEALGYEPSHIGLFGASVGCSVAIDAAHRREGLGPVAVLTPGLNYLGVNSEEHLKEWGTRRILIVSSVEEAPGGPAILMGQLKRQFLERKRKDPMTTDGVTYLALPETRIHGTNMFGAVDDIEARLVGWFEDSFAEADAEVAAEAAGGPTSQPLRR
jgi:pimeloyl-ACP methyl ester carboxylesterase